MHGEVWRNTYEKRRHTGDMLAGLRRDWSTFQDEMPLTLIGRYILTGSADGPPPWLSTTSPACVPLGTQRVQNSLS